MSTLGVRKSKHKRFKRLMSQTRKQSCSVVLSPHHSPLMTPMTARCHCHPHVNFPLRKWQFLPNGSIYTSPSFGIVHAQHFLVFGRKRRSWKGGAAHTTPIEDLSSAPSRHTRQLTSTGSQAAHAHIELQRQRL